MSKKLTKFGNSRGLIIDKALLKLLNITDNTELRISVQDESLVITPIKKTRRKRGEIKDKKLKKIVEEVMEKYEDTLKKLAKS